MLRVERRKRRSFDCQIQKKELLPPQLLSQTSKHTNGLHELNTDTQVGTNFTGTRIFSEMLFDSRRRTFFKRLDRQKLHLSFCYRRLNRNRDVASGLPLAGYFDYDTVRFSYIARAWLFCARGSKTQSVAAAKMTCESARKRDLRTPCNATKDQAATKKTLRPLIYNSTLAHQDCSCGL